MSQSEPLLCLISAKRLTAMVVLMAVACIGGYLLTPKQRAVRREQTRLTDPLHAFSSRDVQGKQLLLLQSQVHANPQNDVKWARLRKYYLWQNTYHNALLAYGQALRVDGENAKIYSTMVTVLYYQVEQHITSPTREMISKALALGPVEVAALVLLISDVFMRVDYVQTVSVW